MITAYRTVDVDGLEVFYREAGDPKAPTILLLHGFPSSSHMFRDLIPLLADRFHLVAPDLPGFGRTALPSRDAFAYKFENLAKVIGRSQRSSASTGSRSTSSTMGLRPACVLRSRTPNA